MNAIRGPVFTSRMKEVMVSVLIHGALISLVLALAGHYAHRPSDLTTILLNMDSVKPRPSDRPGGDGRKAGSEGTDKKAAKGVPKTALSRTPSPVKNQTPPAQDSGKGVTPRENHLHASSPADTSTATNLPGATSLAADSGEYHGLAGNGEGLGGGGGKGLGAYGAGSGFGGTGRGGMGGGRGEGRGSGSPKQADVDLYLKEHYAYIRDLIMRHLVYPPKAKKMGWEGKVTVAFTISETGMASALRVVAGSGHQILDENVMDTIKEVQPFPRPPAPAPLKIPITYRLDNT